MNDEQLYDTILDIGSSSVRAEKEALVKKLLGDEDGRWFLQTTYDPFITFGITPPIPEDIEGGRKSVKFRRAMVEPLLNKLATRKLTGNAAQAEVYEFFQALDRTGRALLWRIMSKDIKAGVGANTLSRVEPGIIPTFSVARAHVYREDKVKGWPYKAEFKLDGRRNTFLIKNGEGAFYTRSGKHVKALDFFIPLLKRVSEIAAKNELLKPVMIDKDGGLSFALDGEAMMGLFSETGVFASSKDAINAELHLYDFMSYDDFNDPNPVGDTLDVRRKNLSLFVSIAKKVLADTSSPEMIQILPQYFINSHEDAHAFFTKALNKTLASYLARGNPEREAELLKTTIDKNTGEPKMLEGAILKDPNGLYAKKKTYDWMKMKAEETTEVPIVGAYLGTPGTVNDKRLGGLIGNYNGVLIYVGGGFKSDERDEIWRQWLETLSNEHVGAFAEEHDASKGRKGHIIKGDIPELPIGLWGRLMEVQYHEVTPDGSLRHNGFVRFRDDKQDETNT